MQMSKSEKTSTSKFSWTSKCSLEVHHALSLRDIYLHMQHPSSAYIDRNKKHTYIVPLEREEDKSAEEQKRSRAKGNCKGCVRSTGGPCGRFYQRDPTPERSSIPHAHQMNLVLTPQSCEGSLHSADGSSLSAAHRQARTQRCSTSGHPSQEMRRKMHQKQKRNSLSP